jgi:RNA polymerase sigma-70 factor, ECF subfamily
MVVAKTSPLADADLVLEIRKGHRALFEVLMRRYNRAVYRAIRAILKNESEVEDAMQQTYIAAFSHLDQFKGDAKFSTWLVRIAINAALARVRREKTEQGGLEMSDERAAEADPEERVSTKEIIGLLEDSVEKLSESHRIVFMLRDVEGFDTAETAETLGVSEDVVKQRLHRARATIRKDLVERVGESAAAVFAFGNHRCDAIVERVLRHLLPATASDHA